MKINQTTLFNQLPVFDAVTKIETAYQKAKELKPGPVLVLDDDPTGIQTVHGIPVYMSWDIDVMEQIFKRREVAFIHTNTRAYSPEKVRTLLLELMKNALETAAKTGMDFEVISRSDSTLRGHFPLETEVIRMAYENATGKKIDGEIIVPFFKEGGRITANDVHYVLEGENCIPANETEFARDPDFGYQHADLKFYVEEKTKGFCKHEEVTCISLEQLRLHKHDEIKKALHAASGFSKIVLNAVDYADVKAFIPPLLEVMHEGKKFLFRTAASFVKTFGFIEDKPLLERKDFPSLRSKKPAILLIAGSYTGKTTLQLEALEKNHAIEKVELNVQKVLEGDFSEEVSHIAEKIDEMLRDGKNPVLFTSRTLVKTVNHLQTAETVSKALVSVVQILTQRPDIVVAKGGITSSVIAVEGLKMKKAMVEGQVLPGVPVVIAGEESKWPDIPYVIFPGNVGHANSISELYRKMISV